MWLIWALVTGLIVGAVARFLLPGRDAMGCLATSLLGIAGSFVGGFIANVLLWRGGGMRPAGFIFSVVGAVLLLLIWRALRSRSI